MTLDGSSFEGNFLPVNFLSDLRVGVTKLEIINSNLDYILEDAFSSEVFRRNLQTLIIDNSKYIATSLSSFQFYSKGTFKGLTSLKTLDILNNPSLDVKEPASLESLANLLTSLKISRVAKPWYPSELLSKVNFTKVTTVDLQTNHFPEVNGSSFTGIAKSVVTLFLTNCKIESIAANTFTNFKSLELLHLQNNLLKSLVTGVFDSLFAIPALNVYLQDNKWVCNCDLASTQQMFQDHSEAFPGAIQCNEPKEMKGLNVIDVELCSEESIATTLTQISSLSIGTQPETTDCSNEQDSENNPSCSSLPQSSSTSTDPVDGTSSSEIPPSSTESTPSVATTTAPNITDTPSTTTQKGKIYF